MIPPPELENHTAKYQNNYEKENSKTNDYSKHYGKFVIFLVVDVSLAINANIQIIFSRVLNYWSNLFNGD